MWIPTEILERLAQSLSTNQANAQDERSHCGIDSLSEIQLHPLLSKAFTNSEIGICREIGFPTPTRERPNESQRQRCDLVLIPEKTESIFDPVHEQRIHDEVAQTLFAGCKLENQASQSACPPELAYWIEVKVIAQFSYIDGVPQANAAYASELTKGPKDDVIKLASDPLIHAGASLVIVFTEYPETGKHDIGQAVRMMIEQDLPISLPEFEQFQIPNFGGNEWCTLCLIPIKF